MKKPCDENTCLLSIWFIGAYLHFSFVEVWMCRQCAAVQMNKFIIKDMLIIA